MCVVACGTIIVRQPPRDYLATGFGFEGNKIVLSQTVEYALRAVTHLAYMQPKLCSTSQLAVKTQVPAAYLSKVLQLLVRAGIVHSQRGVGGGMTLLIPADELTILDVVNAVDPLKRIECCPLGLKSHGKNLCPLHRNIDDAICVLEEKFRKTRLSDILAETGGSIPLCDMSSIVKSDSDD